MYKCAILIPSPSACAKKCIYLIYIYIYVYVYIYIFIYTYTHIYLYIYMCVQDQWTPLHWAALNGKNQMAKQLIAAKADVHVHDQVCVADFYSVLHLSHCVAVRCSVLPRLMSTCTMSWSAHLWAWVWVLGLIWRNFGVRVQEWVSLFFDDMKCMQKISTNIFLVFG